MRLPGPLGYLQHAPEEVWFFLRIAAYAFFIGTVYWFLTYEAAGTMLLYGFGFAAGFAMIILGGASRGRQHADYATAPGELEADGPFGDEGGRIPSPSIAPFLVAMGAGFGGLGLILGPWFIGLGLIILLAGGAQWLTAAQREFRAMDRPAEVRREEALRLEEERRRETGDTETA